MDRRAFLRAAGLTGAAALLSPEVVFAAGAADWTLGFCDVETDIAPSSLTRLRGKAPADLAGALVRNGPARFRRPGGSVGHWFDGDGLVRRFSIQDGEARLSARFVDTPKRRADTAAGAVITPGFGTAPGPGAALGGPDDANAANTSVMMAGGELWALWEPGSPSVLDPVTLETKGFKTLRPDLKAMPFLAHPRREPNGRTWNLGLAGRRAIVWRLAADGSLEDAQLIALPRASYLHDFTATERHIVIVLQPWVQERAGVPYIAGMAWKPELGTQVLVLDKADLSKRRVFDLPPFFFFHLGDAWEDADGAIRFDACIDDDPRGTAAAGEQLLRGVPFKGVAPPKLGFITLHADGKADLQRFDTIAEFPRSDDRFAGRARRFSVHAAVGEPGKPVFHGLAVRDWKSGREAVFDFGRRQLVEEMVFVPRPGGSEEFDGWLVGTSLNLDAQATELHAFDARRVADGPLVTWRSNTALPLGFHGIFTA
ncbi:carotenoid oxygenase family protein [Caulobacter hibisci]|uniref:Dioxygenase n=1 Tax=Caulobacter hibisci TaxID=2035993 RepID=A0ABS0T379_9CAUL|nr:carotenoid oxygenase family protein [Caulobacter hibisci]MBI1686289.1 carotenoid oxygenase family protein [Caulobacter hibisci]